VPVDRDPVGGAATAPTRDELEAAHCWEADDRVPRRPAMTAFRRRTRYDQARWRVRNQHPIGTQPIVPRPGKPSRPVGSRIPLDYGREVGANLITPGALTAARARTAFVESNQSFDHQRLWADLLSSSALAFNLFGDLADHPARADQLVRSWLPDLPGRIQQLRFAHSPGWLDPAYLNSLRSFDAAFILELGGGKRGIVAVDVKLHERNKAETPKPENRARYTAVAQGSHVFAAGVIDELLGRTERCEPWLEHLLLHSMLQHPDAGWVWGRYVVVHPAGNTDVADLCAHYRGALADDTTFVTTTLEQLIAISTPAATIDALTERYLPG
jgi:hypothetical protein